MNMLTSASLCLFFCAFGWATEVRLGFGSCLHQDLLGYSRPLFENLANEAELDDFVWLGDTIYGDKRVFLNWFELNTLEEMSRRYNLVLGDPSYQKVLSNTRRKRPVGVYDDHDYCINSGDSSCPQKKGTQQLFLDFLGEPKGTALRNQEGVYTSYSYADGELVLLLLDIRYFAEPGSLLGEEQWNFLETSIESIKDTAQVIVLANGIQVLASPGIHSETWMEFKADRQRLLEVIKRYSGIQFVILSGDVHYAEILCADLGESSVVDVTSSGLSHAWGEKESVTPSQHTIDNQGKPDGISNIRTWITTIMNGLIRFIFNNVPSRYSLPSSKPKEAPLDFPRDSLDILVSLFEAFGTQLSRGLHSLFGTADVRHHGLMGTSTFFGQNYGLLEYNTESKILTVRVKDKHGVTRLCYETVIGTKSSVCNPIDIPRDAQKLEIYFHILCWVFVLVLPWYGLTKLLRRCLCSNSKSEGKKKLA